MVAVGTRISPRPPGHRRRSPAPGSHRSWRADFPHHALRQLVRSFHCYLFKLRFHGQLIFSLNRRPCLPLNGAHVAPRTIQLPLTASLPHMAGSPVLRGLSVSMTSTRSSDPSLLVGLAGPTSLRSTRMGSGCFLWLHGGGTTPGSTSDRSRCRGLRFRLPRYGIGSATPITIDFGAIFPFTSFRPTTSLSTLRSGRYRTPRKTRFAAAR